VRVQLEVRLADDGLARSAAQLDRERALLNGMLARDPAAELVLAADEPRALPAGEDELLVLLAARNADLAGLAHEIQQRAGAVEVARQAYVPDLSPRLGFIGSVEQFVGASIGLPANLPAIRASIERARADLESLEASARQRQRGLAAELAAEFVVLRDAERALRFFADDVVPIAQRLSQSTRTSYASGGASQRDWIESQRAELDARAALVQARASRATALARIEWLAGTEIAELTPKQEVALEAP
jgi:outer membrane protein TolC